MAVLGCVLSKCSNCGHAFSDFTFHYTNPPNRKFLVSIPPYKVRVSDFKPSIRINKTRVVSMNAAEKSKNLTQNSFKQKRVPVFVMMPLDPFSIDTRGTVKINKMKALSASVKALKMAGVHGIAVEVWWGIVERDTPLAYDWSLYEELFKMISEQGLKLHVSLCFHSNTHLSSCQRGSVGLPLWIQKIGAANKDIYYQDRKGFPCHNCLTLGVDEVPLFGGRTALECYENFIFDFVKTFDSLMGHVIEEISIGLGPAGELKYPAHPCYDGRWTFPGIGEFQCYDKYMLEDLKIAADLERQPEWGENGPQRTGDYKSIPSRTPFFKAGPESFLSDYGHFFLDWYSGKLIHHADVILGKAAEMLKKYQQDDETSVLLVAKVGVIYWWYLTLSHAAELTAGYYNTFLRDGYDPLASMLLRHGAALHISCLEMTDSDTPPEYECSPQRLLQQLFDVSKKRMIKLTGRNCMERFDKKALQRIIGNCYMNQEETVAIHEKTEVNGYNTLAEALTSFTYFRMGPNIFETDNFSNFIFFIRSMGGDC